MGSHALVYFCLTFGIPVSFSFSIGISENYNLFATLLCKTYLISISFFK